MPCLYYSPMNFKAVLIIGLSLLSVGCSHTKKDSSLESTKDRTAQLSKQDHDTSLPSAGDPITPTLEPETTTDTAIDVSEFIGAESTANANDVIARIRQGFAFPDLMTTDVKQHEKWASEHKTYLTNLFGRAEPFLFFIVEEIEKRGLPMELALLPAVESAYDPGAVSRSKAAGIWQFVPTTGRGFGLNQNWWYDGRHDPYSSTFAALDYLEQLHKMFDGDWFLALAAYNAGPGTLRREIRRAKRAGRATDYVSLKLRAETRRYIPKLIALKRIVADPSAYAVELPKIANQPFFEVIALDSQIDLNDFAKKSGVDKRLLRHLNRGFKRWATAPDGPYRVLVPLDESQKADYAIAAIAKLEPIDYRNHKIKSGDTLSGIAKQYGVSVSALRQTNKLSSSRIRAGKSLLIPLSEASARKHKATQGVAVSGESSGQSKVSHKVIAGETLWSIAKRYKVNLDQLMSWNNMQHGDVLSLNQILTVFLN